MGQVAVATGVHDVAKSQKISCEKRRAEGLHVHVHEQVEDRRVGSKCVKQQNTMCVCVCWEKQLAGVQAAFAPDAICEMFCSRVSPCWLLLAARAQYQPAARTHDS